MTPHPRGAPAAAPAHGWLAWLAPDASPAPTQVERADWERIVPLAARHHVAAALCRRLTDAAVLDAVPSPARAALTAALHKGQADALVWQRALRLVLPALLAQGVVVAPYKGAALAFLAYRDPAMRSMSDLDFWIDDEAMPAACRALEAIGFERREKSERPVALQARYDGEIPFSGRRVGVPLVELHWGVFPGEWMRRTTAIDRAAVRARRQPASLFGHAVEVLAPEDHLLQVALHGAINHVHSIAALRSLLDLVVIAGHGVDWHEVVERARAWRVARVIGHTLGLAGELFDRDEFRAASGQLLDRGGRRALHRFASPDSLMAVRRLDQGVRKWRYLVAAVDRPRDRLQLVARSLWPEPDWLGARYGRSGVRVRAGHLAGALRFRF